MLYRWILLILCLASPGWAQELYADPDHRFQLTIPAGWRVDQVPAAFPETCLKVVSTGEGQLYVDRFPGVQTDLRTAVDATRQYVTGELQGKILSEQPLELGSLPALQLRYLGNSSLSARREFLHTLVLSRGTLYIVHGVAPSESFARYQPDYQAMTSSFRVLTP